MSIPLKVVSCATTLSLAMVPGVAEAAAGPAGPPAGPGGREPESAAGAHEAPPAAPAGGQQQAATAPKTSAQGAAAGTAAAPGTSGAAGAAATKTAGTAQAGQTATGGEAAGTVRQAHKAQQTGAAGATRALHSRTARAQHNAMMLAAVQKAVRAKRAKLEAQWERRAERAVGFALRQKGRPYVWGGSGGRGFDCSGLVQQAWRRAGVSIPRVTTAQYRRIRTKVARTKLRPGDLVFFNRLAHVGMYVGRNRFVHSPRTGRTITTERLRGYYRQNYVGAVRPAWKKLPPVPTSL
ncbi:MULTISPECIES: C40 family peptidase [Actinomadura]|uniref:C40 family peptidase n=2 Tax=Actinomadura yumaensis TaxID=111807 RepID=A0ABW2CRP0_9ACTN|nr:C40 family peptidase [Actinomadura sp. J1-007]